MHRRSAAVHDLLRLLSGVLAGVLLAGLAACSASVPKIDAGAGLTCVDDTPICIKRRSAALDGLMADKSRAWLRRPAGPKAYASGVRLFAMRKTKSAMTCDELKLARRETSLAKASLRAKSAGLTPAQISRAMILAGEVGRELAREVKRRCARG